MEPPAPPGCLARPGRENPGDNEQKLQDESRTQIL